MPSRRDVGHEELAVSSGVWLGSLLTLPMSIYFLTEVVVQTGWYPVLVVILLSNLPLTLFRLWRAWYPFSFLGSVTPAASLTDDQLRILTFLTSREARRYTWEAGLVPTILLVTGVGVLQVLGVVTTRTLAPGAILKPDQMPGMVVWALVLPWLLNAVSVFLCLVGWPFWRAYRDWPGIVRTYPPYPLERFRKDFLAPRPARAGLGGPQPSRVTPVPNPVLRSFSTRLRWTQGVAAVLCIVGVPALYRGAVTLLSGVPARSDAMLSAGMMVVGGSFLALGAWLWKK